MFGWIHKCFSAIIFQIQTQFSASFVDLLRLLTLRLHNMSFNDAFSLIRHVNATIV